MDKDLIFLTGATGFVGRHILASLLENDADVIALTRKNQSDVLEKINNSYPNRLKVVYGDLTNKIDMPEEVTTIYHCAGVILNEEQMQAVNVEGTRRMVEAALVRGCRLIHLSSAGVVGKTKDHLIDENTACNPYNKYEQSKYEAEKIVLDGIKRGLKAQILRPTTIIGTGRAENQDSILQMFRTIKRGWYRNIGNGLHNLIHVNEVVRVMHMLNSDAIPNGGIFISNNPIGFRDMANIVRLETTGQSGEIGSIPYGLAFMAAICGSALSFVSGRRIPLTLSRFQALTDKRVFSQDRIVSKLGYQPLHPIEDYVKILCHDYIKQGLL
ncbi:MAG: NAD-dependent epimerase/dehydratase family protein [Syntrophomonadaceae bacterium]|mgnify:CR=1 FL=1|nr:NAD-dependent epimerase/dehydratase family protein [Syntrophomonadaceae bacterium]